MKPFAIIMIALAVLFLGTPARAQISASTIISKTDTTKTYFHSIGYKIGKDQRCELTLQVPHTSVTTDYVQFAFGADTTNVVTVYKGTSPRVIDNVRIDSVYVKGSGTGLTFRLTAIKK